MALLRFSHVDVNTDHTIRLSPPNTNKRNLNPSSPIKAERSFKRLRNHSPEKNGWSGVSFSSPSNSQAQQSELGSVVGEEESEVEAKCRICLEALGEDRVITSPCKHVFCGVCWEHWARFYIGETEIVQGDDEEREFRESGDDDEGFEEDSEGKDGSEDESDEGDGHGEDGDGPDDVAEDVDEDIESSSEEGRSGHEHSDDGANNYEEGGSQDGDADGDDGEGGSDESGNRKKQSDDSDDDSGEIESGTEESANETTRDGERRSEERVNVGNVNIEGRNGVIWDDARRMVVKCPNCRGVVALVD